MDFRKEWSILKKNKVISSKKLRFFGIKPVFDIYNPSKTFNVEGRNYIFGRVEKRRDHAKSKIFLFEEVSEDIFKVEKRFKSLDLEDPFITSINKEFILGGVRVRRDAFSGKISFKTIFYRFTNPFSLHEFAQGPKNMKDIRLVDMGDSIGVFTRPMGGKFGRGKIGFTVINSLETLNEETINSAKLIRFPFGQGEWGGVNDVINLGKNKLGVFGHLSFLSNVEKRNYFPISFMFDVKTRKITKLRLLFRREDLDFDLPKSKILYNVIFPGGCIIEGSRIKMYCGVGDSFSYKVILDNPFK